MTDKASNQFFMPHNVLEEAKFRNQTPSAKILFMYLCKLKNRLGDDHYRSIGSLAHDAGLSINSIKSAKKELEKNMYLDVKRDYFLNSGYRSADRFHLNGYKYLDNPTD
ncbi:MAG: helix-turn-helix domain-containing protein [Candidatus Heimdallarchaeota archaeon]